MKAVTRHVMFTFRNVPSLIIIRAVDEFITAKQACSEIRIQKKQKTIKTYK